MIEFACPDCDEEMEIADRMAGKTIKCVNCGSKILVPEDAATTRTTARGIASGNVDRPAGAAGPMCGFRNPIAIRSR
jgi:DNA-directed RNA polymerase subunit RPC12/RpoP